MSHDLIPELHDILKLCKPYRFLGKGKERSPHSNVHSVLIEAKNKGFDLDKRPSWFGVLKHHHGRNFKLFPDTPDLFLLDMADSLAAAISRGDNRLRLGHPCPFKKYGFDDKIFKLWKNHPNDKKRSRHVRPLELEKIFEFLKVNPTFEMFYELVKDAIHERAEDATIGANLTSLYIHSILTGKFSRLLKRASYTVTAIDLGDRKSKLQRLYKNKLDEWSFTVLKLKIHFPQKPIRTKDMNVFEILDNTRKRIESDFNDSVFFNTSDEILMVWTPNINTHSLKSYLDYGFWIEYSERTQFLRDLSPNLNEGKGQFKEGVVYKRLDTQISPHICEICQMKKAEKEWVKDFILTMDLCETCKEVISKSSWPPDIKYLCKKDILGLEKWFDEKVGEDLCQDCFNIRICLKETRLKKLEKWSEEDIDNPKVIWIKVNLDFLELIKSLKELYAMYLEDIKVPNFRDNVEIRFSVLYEFYRDYSEFLCNFEKKLRNRFKDSMEVPILKDFFVIKIEALSQILDVISDYDILFTNYFTRFKILNDSPLKLSISCSNAKFPFFEHWEILKKPQSDIHITLFGKGEVKINIKNLEEILIRNQHMKTRSNIRALHKLAEIAKLSEKLAAIALKDKSDKDYKTYKEILPMGMDFHSLLTLAKILEDRYEVP